MILFPRCGRLIRQRALPAARPRIRGILEPTDLGLLLGGVGILWAELTVRGLPAHAESAHRAVNPVDAALRLITAVRSLEKEMALQLDGPFADVDGACAVNVGTFRAGDWPSSVPGQAVLGVRVGFPPGRTPDEALKRVADAVAAAAAADPWLAGHPPGVRAVAYGPRTRNIHATDEAVELDSIVAGARTLARFLAGYYATGGLPAGSAP